MKAQLQSIEIERPISCDYDLAIENTARRQLPAQRIEQLREIAVQRLLITALQQDFVAVAKDQRAKPVPLRFEDPRSPARQFIHSFGEHRQHRRIYRKAHASDAIPRWRLRAGALRSSG